jgi:hypothetical protein
MSDEIGYFSWVMSRKLQLAHRVEVVISYLRSLLELYLNQINNNTVAASIARHCVTETIAKRRVEARELTRVNILRYKLHRASECQGSHPHLQLGSFMLLSMSRHMQATALFY